MPLSPPQPPPIAPVLTLGPMVRGTNFFGRDQEVAKMWGRLQHESLLLLAPRRVGKSSLMLALADNPRAGFQPYYINVESLAHPAQFVAALAKELGVSPGLRDMLAKVPGLGELVKATAEIKVGETSLRFDGPDWREVGKKIIDALRSGSPGGKNAKDSAEVTRLFLLDEFPYFIQHMAKREGGRDQCDEFLAWFRSLRCDPELGPRIRYVLCGSIGLRGLLSRLKLSASMNDVKNFPLGPYSAETAMAFLCALEQGEQFHLTAAEREELLRAIGYHTPYYIQLLFSEVKECAASPGRINDAFDRLLAHRESQLRHMEERLIDVFPDPATHTRAESILRAACKESQGIYYAEAAQAADGASDGQVVDILESLRDDGYLRLEYHQDDLKRCAFTSELLRRYWRRRNPG